MIYKNFEIKKINLNISKKILLYGKNEELKNEAIQQITQGKKNILNYEEKEITDNSKLFIENLLSKSLFETEKIIIVKRVTDKILNIIDEIKDLVLDDIIIILNSEILEKKSKLRSYFEKDKKNICIAFYPDDNQILSKLAINFFKDKDFKLSQENINFLVNKCNGNRGALLRDLEKIEYFSVNGKKLTPDNLHKLINLHEDHTASELIDYCLAKNENKTITILNENNFSLEDSILIIRVLLNKSKKIHRLSTEFEKNKNIELTISSAKPPIFWKDKEITKQQIYKWQPSRIKTLIYKINELELIIKKNYDNSLNLITDFILELASSKN
tara:strand:+ start:579 stop:1565 length:987 start_codon:yes stop_codon:yes gene_type:complete